jgi:hypothetical protein
MLDISVIAPISQIELELQKRLAYPYTWVRKQNREKDTLTNFIYDMLYFEDVLAHIEKHFSSKSHYQSLKNYALNRWFNFWSANAIEKIFVESDKVSSFLKEKSRYLDFCIQDIPFDHKNTVFPQNYPYSFKEAQENTYHFIKWLYENQSQENRLHYKNRLFIVFYDQQNGEHWKLKANIKLIRTQIHEYLVNFSFQRLKSIPFKDTEMILSDIIWVIN